MHMTCYNAKRYGNAYVDGTLRTSDRTRLIAHMSHCEGCASYFEQIASVRSALKSLPKAVPPSNLAMSLQILASREKQSVRANRGSRLRELWDRWSFRIDMLMRPFTIPATGGVLSSMLLFVTLAFAIGTTTRVVSYEVPVLEANRLTANLVPLELRSRAVVLTISLDRNGHISDYAVGDGSASYAGDGSSLQYDKVAVPDLPGIMVLPRPISGDIRISFTPLALRQ